MSIFDQVRGLVASDHGSGEDIFGTIKNTIGLFKKPSQKGMAELQAGITLQTDALNQAASSERIAANFNNRIAQINSSRQQAALARQTERNIATHRANAAGKGFSSTSKTSMMFMNEELTNFQRAISQEQSALRNEQAARTFQAEGRARGFELQARTASARGERTRQEYKKSGISRGKQLLGAAKQLPGIAKQIGGLLGGE